MRAELWDYLPLGVLLGVSAVLIRWYLPPGAGQWAAIGAVAVLLLLVQAGLRHRRLTRKEEKRDERT